MNINIAPNINRPAEINDHYNRKLFLCDSCGYTDANTFFLVNKGIFRRRQVWKCWSCSGLRRGTREIREAWSFSTFQDKNGRIEK